MLKPWTSSDCKEISEWMQPDKALKPLLICQQLGLYQMFLERKRGSR